MGPLLRYFVTTVLVVSAFFGQAQGTLTTYYTIPPTNGCDGLWAFGPASAMYDTCAAPFSYAVDPAGCGQSPWGWPPFWMSGDTVYVELCSVPCNLQVWSGNGLCQQLICQLGPLSMAENVTKEVTVFPNPAPAGTSHLVLDVSAIQRAQVLLQDLTGKVVLEQAVRRFPVQVDIGALSPGIYALHVAGPSGSAQAIRFVIQ